MFDPGALLAGGLAIIALAVAAWLWSLAIGRVDVADIAWGPLFVAGGAAYALSVPAAGPRTALVLSMVFVWALRLSAHIGWRSRGEPEDRRYRAMRERNQPGFAFKSLFLVFGLQGLLAWIVSLSLLAAISGPAPLGPLDWAGMALWAAGFGFEVIADRQLARFKARPQSAGEVLDRGLWRYSRHPNYFGECCLWWGLFLMALGAGGGWAVVSPVLMTFLLLRVSGVTLLEKDIGDRRPQYAAYRARTNAFLPGPVRGDGSA